MLLVFVFGLFACLFVLFVFVCLFVVGFCCFVKSEHKEQTNKKLADNPRDAIIRCCYVVFVEEETGRSWLEF